MNQIERAGEIAYRLRSRAYEVDLKKLLDDELMQLNIKLSEQTLEEEKHNIAPDRRHDSALTNAIDSEVNRRSIAAGWFWRRWRKPQEHKKWVEHNQQMEQRAYQIIMEVLSRVEQYECESLESEEYIDKTSETDS